MFLPAAGERVELVEVISLAYADNERLVAIWEAADTRDAVIVGENQADHIDMNFGCPKSTH